MSQKIYPLQTTLAGRILQQLFVITNSQNLDPTLPRDIEEYWLHTAITPSTLVTTGKSVNTMYNIPKAAKRESTNTN